MITESHPDSDQNQDIPPWSETDDQLVRGGSANPIPVSYETDPDIPRHRVIHSPQVHAAPKREPSVTFNGALGPEPSPLQSVATEPTPSRFPVPPQIQNLSIQGPLHPWNQPQSHNTPWQQQLRASTFRPTAQAAKTFNSLKTPVQTGPLVVAPATYQHAATPALDAHAQPDRSRLSLSFRKKQTAQRDKDALREQEQHRLARGHFDKQERKELLNADDIGAEARSQDTDPGRAKTRHGYDREGCASTTDDELRSSSEEEDDTESCVMGSDASSTEADDEPTLRQQVVDHVLKKYPILCAPSSLQIAPIVLNRETGRTDYMVLLLNTWLRPDASVTASQAMLFLKLMKLLPQEAQREVFANLVRSIKKRSEDIFLFLFHSVRHYLPEAIPAFKAIIKKNKKVDEKSKSKTSGATTGTASPKDSDKKKPKPTVPKPTLKNIEDIATVTFQFFNEYSRYQHDHEASGYHYSSLFGCLATGYLGRHVYTKNVHRRDRSPRYRRSA